jgi:TetR/AcrR family transcriptional repressor of lfrA
VKDDEQLPDSGLKARTRLAILDAAVVVFAATSTATLADVAKQAGVVRTTVHRYFPERIDLLRALTRHVYMLSVEAIARAEPEDGPAIDALRRVVESQFDLGPILLFVTNDPAISHDPELMALFNSGVGSVAEVLDRASQDTEDSLPGWAERVFWALLYAGWEAAAAGGSSRRRIIDAIMRSLTRGTIS